MSITQIESLTSGECRWIGREDVHVYCHAPAGRDAAYCIVCPEAGLNYGTWITADEAAVIVDRIVAGAVPARCRRRRERGEPAPAGETRGERRWTTRLSDSVRR